MKATPITPQPKFDVSDFVRRKSNPDIAGKIYSQIWDEQAGCWTYRVRFGSGIRGVPEQDIERVPDVSGPWEEFDRGRFASADAFKELLTYERLRKPPNRIANSFGSAKAAFFPYQFKPLLKFLENPDQRILIADDVGLGKTIEAGYILRELRVRHGVDRALIVVPARLRNKWKDELDRRFNETFEIVFRSDLHDLGQQLRRGRELKPFRWIVSYESARDTRLIKMFDEFQPPLDIVIFDEAHRMRNRPTDQSRLGRALGNCADSLVMLTATPIQTGIDNLFTLFQIMDPDSFSDPQAFISQMEANRPIIRALNAIRSRPLNSNSIVSELHSIRANPVSAGLARGKYFESLLRRSAAAETISDSELVELQRDISELSLTGYMLSRTRKADVLTDRPTRIAKACKVTFSASERAFYDAVAGLCRVAQPDLSGWGLAMSTLTAYRYTASCIPAAIEYFRARFTGSELTSGDLSRTEEDGAYPERFASNNSERTQTIDKHIDRELEELVERFSQQPLLDTKFNTFLLVIRGIWKDDAEHERTERKIIVFSYFKRTLYYLSDQLTECGIGHQLITGDIPIPAREKRIDRFATRTDMRILLSSEVGSEGLDLQFASVLVNYDLPWNPMVVEQRIGRVDRIGQKSEVITILNLVVDDTVEERILLRLYERIGLFRDTIGELDPILGQKFERLTASALRGKLTAKEEQRQADEAVRAVLGQEQQARSLEHEADGLMAADQSFLDEVNAMIGRRRTPAPEELHKFLHVFLQRRYPGSGVSTNAIRGIGALRLDPNAVTDVRNTLGLRQDVHRLLREISTGRLDVTFDQDTALDHASVELLHARHPLLTFAFQQTRKKHDQLHRVFALALDHTKAHSIVVPGMYAFDIRLLDLNGVRPRTDIVPMFFELHTGRLIDGDDAESILRAMLESCSDVRADPVIEKRFADELRESFESAAIEYRGQVQRREEQLNQARAERQRVTMETSLGNRVSKARARLSRLREREAAEFPIRMQQRKLEIAKNELARRLDQLQAGETLRLEYEEIAAGLLLIE